MSGAAHTASNGDDDLQEGKEKAPMERQGLSSIDTFAFTDNQGQRFRLVQTGSRQGRLLVRLEQYNADVPESDRWQAIAETLHISLAIASAQRAGAARPQRIPTSRRIGLHLTQVADRLFTQCLRLAPRRASYVPLPLDA